MVRIVYVVAAAALLSLCSAQQASAQNPCQVYEGGTVKDVRGNNVYNNFGQTVNLSGSDASSCIYFATAEVTGLAYNQCVSKGSGVTIAISGQAFLYGASLGYVYAPNSCRTAWGLNFYNILVPGGKMFPLDSILPPNNSYTLDYQTDGNFVLYGPTPGSPYLTTPIWATNCWSTCFSIGGAGYAEMTTGGNLRLVNDVGTTVWQTSTSGAGAFLAVRNSGQLVIYNTLGGILWTN